MQPDVSNRRALTDRLDVLRSDIRANMERLSVTLAEVEKARERWVAGKATRQILHESAYARLLSRFESQPVIEQAKGILMAESHCSADEAFEMLRRASQRQNVRVRDLAAQIVARASSSQRHRASTGRPQGTDPEKPGQRRGQNGQRQSTRAGDADGSGDSARDGLGSV